MNCPFCGHTETKVLDKRETADGKTTRRRRECLKCTKRFTTYERMEMGDLSVVKKDGRRELFDRTKVERGVLRACEKRPVSREAIELLVDEVENEIRNRGSAEVSSKLIGDIVMKKLKRLDKIAYIRFASVYRDFTDLQSFQQELKQLAKK